jgi:hypothetical protein
MRRSRTSLAIGIAGAVLTVGLLGLAAGILLASGC